MRCGGKFHNDRQLADRHKKILDLISKQHTEGDIACRRLLDAGCGNGSLSSLIKEAFRATEVYGIEICESTIRLARNEGVEVIHADIDRYRLPFEDNSFDAVFAGEVIEHLLDPEGFVKEVHRILRRNGVFVITTPNLACVHNRIALLLGYYPFGLNVLQNKKTGHIVEKPSADLGPVNEFNHIRPFTFRLLTDFLIDSDFQIIEANGASMPAGLLPFPLSLVDRAFSAVPTLSYIAVIVARKKSDLQ